MNPYSFSATSLQAAGECLARYKAEFVDRGRDFQGNAAGVGIVCHGTLEDFLRAVFIKKSLNWTNEAAFRGIFNDNFMKVFGAQQTTDEYEDAWDLCYRWYHRDDQEAKLRSVKILSLESKNSFPVKTSIGDKPFNYIMDRVDRVDEDTIRVVDYKSNRAALTAEQLRNKKQARYYALAMQIVYPKTKEIWVEFDFLRHRPVSVMFTRDDNVATYRELRRAAQRIVDAPDTRVPETLNPGCGWCVRKSSCKTLLSNIKVGGIMSKSIDDLARIYGQLTDQAKAQKELSGQIEMLLLHHAVEEDLTEYETDTSRVTVYLPTRRSVNSQVAAAVLGGSASEYANFTVTTIDKLLRKNSSLQPGQRELLKEAIETKTGDPAVKIEPKDVF